VSQVGTGAGGNRPYACQTVNLQFVGTTEDWQGRPVIQAGDFGGMCRLELEWVENRRALRRDW